MSLTPGTGPLGGSPVPWSPAAPCSTPCGSKRVIGPLRDPFHRIDLQPSSRPVQISAGGQVLADSERAGLLFETGLPARAYILRADVRAPIEPAEKPALRAYEGVARYWTVGGVNEAAWSYDYPRPEATGVTGQPAFAVELADVQIG